ncbi:MULTISPECIES: GGDEF domain-containing protein [Aliagarivorans]|uniref:GGDEF domain-containing protein n=1 Tax=Aliagarivorans TaxID=882379 RepID=UPI0004208B12|nr:MULTISPECIES: GGDEF domain-containing protein [Aliagarivorans]
MSLEGYFDTLLEADSGLWLYQQQDDQLCVSYPWIHTGYQRFQLQPWLMSLDPCCRSAFASAFERSMSQQSPLVMHYCHSEDEWLRLNAMPITVAGQQVVFGSILPLTMPEISDHGHLRDPQTGLLRGQMFREMLIQALRLSQRNLESFSLLTLQIPESYDEDLFIQLAATLRTQLRRSDSIAKFGQRELVALLYGANRHSCELMIPKLQQALIGQLNGQRARMAWVHYPEVGESADTILAHRMDDAIWLGA